MPYSRFVVEVQSPGCPVCRSTADHKEAVAILRPLSSQLEGPPEGFHVVLNGGEEIQKALDTELSEWADQTDLLRQTDDGASWLVREPGETGATEVFPTVVEATDDALFEPVIGREGWLTIPFVAPYDGRDPAEIVQDCQETLEADGHKFRLIRYRDFDPDRAVASDNSLSDKQQEVVRVAYSMGYYETPRQCTLQELADVFGVSKAAIHMRIRTAERKIVDTFVSPEV